MFWEKHPDKTEEDTDRAWIHFGRSWVPEKGAVTQTHKLGESPTRS